MMLPALIESKQEFTEKSLAKAGHALVLLPVSDTLPALAGQDALAAAMRRRKRKPRDLLKTPLAVELPGGTLAVYAMLQPDATAFDMAEAVRRALAPLLAEQPDTLAIGVTGDAAFRARSAQVAVYAALVNGVVLPTQKKDAGRAIGRVALYGHVLGAARARVEALAEGNTLCRSLTALPPNTLTPGEYRKRIRRLAKTYGLSIEEFDFATLKKMGAGAFCAVAQGSPAKDAAIVHLRWSGGGRKAAARRARKTLALVGKGICFDTGGHNLKPAKYMQGMHEDMNGSAVVLGILAAASRLASPVAIDAWLAIAENHISPLAYRQNEVVRALNGTTIEVVHTDAEGRMVLADALTLAARGKPGLIADFATLTGSMHYALGSRMSGLFATSSALAHQAARAASASGERIVVFPHPADYDPALESAFADIKQCTLEGEADHILAARFLSRFVGETPWLHMDLSASSCKGGLGAVASDLTGFGVAWGVALIDELLKPEAA
jgi:leucyl aminopeptidase